MHENDWPKHINGDRDHIACISQLLAISYKLEGQKCRMPADHDFMHWLLETHEELTFELAEEFNEYLQKG